MGEKVAAKNEGEGDKNAAAEGGAPPPMTVVLKLDLHCAGCAKKVRRSVSHLEGVETVKADCDAKKLTVTGSLDPALLREKVEIKTKKKVELISPPPKKSGESGGAAAGVEKKAEEEKPKEAVVSTVTMKTKLHCDGCANKIRRIIIKNFDGVDSLTTNLQKDLITIVGTMDVKNLVTFLGEKLKRGIEIVPPPKQDPPVPVAVAIAVPPPTEKVTEGKEKANGGEGQEKKKSKERDDTAGKKEVEPKSSAESGGGEEMKVEVSKLEHHISNNTQTHYAMPMAMHSSQRYGHNQDYGMSSYASSSSSSHMAGPFPPLPPPTYLDTYNNDSMFSDENPNGCIVM